MSGVLITGATGAIGSATTLAMARAGFDVAIHYHRNEQKAKELAHQLEIENRRAFIFQADLYQEVDWFEIGKQCVERFGRLSALVLNAGEFLVTSASHPDGEDYEAMLQIHFKASVRCCTTLLPFLKQSKGASIVLISTAGVRVQGKGGTAYNVAKAALESYGRSLAQELGPENIRVNIVAPGFVPSKMTEATPPAEVATLMSRCALNRPGKPEELAEAITFLAGPQSSYITGHILQVDGGLI